MKKRLLVVDDNDVDRIGIAGLLERAGFDVVGAKDGQQATLSIQAGLTPDVILLDMIMPVHDGWEFLETRKNDACLGRIPVIVVTGLAIASEGWAQDLGAQALIKKPIDTNSLFVMVRSFGTRSSDGTDSDS